MKPEDQQEREDYGQPAAYDAQGRPLFLRPQEELKPANRSIVTERPEAYEGNNFDPKIRAQYANEPGIVHATRAIEPVVPEVSDMLRRKNEESKRLYPFLNLSEGEFVIMRIKRHPIGLFIPVAFTALTIIILSVFLFLVPDIYNAISPNTFASLPSIGVVAGVLLILIAICAIIGGIAVWVYLRNQFFLTNEAVIQEIQYSLFSHHEQTVSLGSIEDASFRRNGILQHIFNYGTMRLSTEGEETTYRFHYVESPKEQVAIVNDAVEAFKNGRPVGNEFLDS